MVKPWMNVCFYLDVCPYYNNIVLDGLCQECLIYYLCYKLHKLQVINNNFKFC